MWVLKDTHRVGTMEEMGVLKIGREKKLVLDYYGVIIMKAEHRRGTSKI